MWTLQRSQVHVGSILGKDNGYDIMDCRGCGFIHVSPIPSDEELFKMYNQDFYQTLKPEYITKEESELEYWKVTFNDKLDYLDEHIKSSSKRILDIGCGPGFFLASAKNRGWDILGIEPSEQAAEYAVSHGIPIIKDIFQRVDFMQLGKFDAIHLKFFLEHYSSPHKAVETCHSLLKEGGIMIVEVPNDFNPLQGVVTKALQKHRYWLAPPQHINYFGFDSLSRLLRKHSFDVVRKESTFPLELFLLMGFDYIGNDPVGRTKHHERMVMELNMNKGGGNDLKRRIYQGFAQLEIGREAIIYAKKCRKTELGNRRV